MYRVINRLAPILAMSSLKPTDIDEKFEIWFDEEGKNRDVSYNLPRVKCKANDSEIVIKINTDGSLEIHNPNGRYNSKIKKFRYSKDALKFVEKFKEPILMHWNQEISTLQLFKIIDYAITNNCDANISIKHILSESIKKN